MAGASHRDRRAAAAAAAVEIECRERAAPHAARVEADHIVAQDEAQRRPMTEHHAGAARAAALELEPRAPRRVSWRRLAFEAQVDTSIVGANAHPRQDVDGKAQA